jgi:hypothetical protein
MIFVVGLIPRLLYFREDAGMARHEPSELIDDGRCVTYAIGLFTPASYFESVSDSADGVWKRGMSKLAKTFTDFVFPQNQRPLWTFGNVTVVVLLATFATALVRAFVRFSPAQVARLESQSLLHSPVFVSLYYVSLTFVLWLVYSTRNRAHWHPWRVMAFGMALAGALIGIVDLMLPLRSV